MPNDKALEALSRIAENEDWRRAFVRELIAFEHAIKAPGVDLREEITGPLVDALFDDDQVVRRTLSSGVTFEFLYRSKIARDFVMSEPEAPDHAWEPQTSRILVNLAKGAKQVVIGGAYFGDHAILIAREIAAGGGVVHAFEPNNEQRAMLTRNAEINGLSNIRPRPEGLWSDSSTSLKLVGYDSFATAEVAEAGADDGFKTESDHSPSGRGRILLKPLISALRVSMARCSLLGSKACTTPPAGAIARAIRMAWSPK